MKSAGYRLDVEKSSGFDEVISRIAHVGEDFPKVFVVNNTSDLVKVTDSLRDRVKKYSKRAKFFENYLHQI